MPATAQVNTKLDPLYARLGNLALILGRDSGLLNWTFAMRTLHRQRYLHHLIDLLRNRPSAGPTILLTGFASRFLRVKFRMAS
jgi:hypothetical protein